MLGSSFPIADLGLLLDRSTPSLLPSLDEGLRSGLLQEAGGGGLRFRHDVIREAIYLDLSPSVRANLHREAAEKLASAGAPPLRIAEHLVRTAAAHDQWAISWLMGSAIHVAPAAPGEAVKLLRHALAMVGPSESLREEIRMELVLPLFWSGRTEEAATLTRELLERHHDRGRATRLRFGLVLALLNQGHTEEACRQAEAALADCDAANPIRPDLQAHAALARSLSGDLGGAETAAREAMDGAAGDHHLVCSAASVLCVTAALRGHPTEALRHATTVADHERQMEATDHRRWHSHLFIGLALMEADRYEEAAHALSYGRKVTEERGGQWNVPLYLWGLALVHFLTGRWDEAVAEATSGTAIAEEVGAGQGIVLAHVTLALIALYRGRLQATQRLLASAATVVAQAGVQYRSHLLGWARALLHEAAGEPVRAMSSVERAWVECHERGVLADCALMGPDVVRLALVTGKPDTAVSAVDTVTRVAHRMATPSATALARRCRGLLDHDPGILAEAAALARQSGRRLLQAQAAEEVGHALIPGHRAEALPAFEEALTIYDQLAANPHAARVRAVLRTLGVRRVRPPSRKRPKTGWESLTRTERDIAHLVVQGLTNRELPTGCSSPPAPSRPTSPTSSVKLESTQGSSSPRRWPTWWSPTTTVICDGVQVAFEDGG